MSLKFGFKIGTTVLPTFDNSDWDNDVPRQVLTAAITALSTVLKLLKNLFEFVTYIIIYVKKIINGFVSHIISNEAT